MPKLTIEVFTDENTAPETLIDWANDLQDQFYADSTATGTPAWRINIATIKSNQHIVTENPKDA